MWAASWNFKSAKHKIYEHDLGEEERVKYNGLHFFRFPGDVSFLDRQRGGSNTLNLSLYKNLRTTDDKFLIEIEVEGSTEMIKKMLKKTGAIEINEKQLKS